MWRYFSLITLCTQTKVMVMNQFMVHIKEKKKRKLIQISPHFTNN